jgi:hypothetical protein
VGYAETYYRISVTSGCSAHGERVPASVRTAHERERDVVSNGCDDTSNLFFEEFDANASINNWQAFMPTMEP